MDRSKIFDRAFKKASILQPGQESTLTETENQILLEAIEAYQRRKDAAFERFQDLLRKQQIELPHSQAKLLFKQYWEEGHIR